VIVEPHRIRQGTVDPTRIVLKGVWRSLEGGKWKSRAALKEASDADDDSLTCIINFLTRWEFVDIKQFPELLLRRKPGSFSPMETFEVLSRLADQSLPLPSRSRIGERVACRACDWQELNFVGPNEVECTRCHEKQWYAIEAEARTERKSSYYLRILDQVLGRLGLPQRHQDNMVA
jgi:hypothetical protein